jgi:hypothetical protein
VRRWCRVSDQLCYLRLHEGGVHGHRLRGSRSSSILCLNLVMPVSTVCLGARVVSPNRFTKALARRAKVSWRDRPTRYDIEALQANIARVGLVIHVRWALVAVLSVFTLLGVWVYGAEVPWSELAPNIRIPALAVGFVCLYNAYYHLTYKRLGNIAFLNHAQLLFDVIVVTVLVYYSGGVNSWFYAMYALFVLEAAFILPKSLDAWIIAGFSAIAYGGRGLGRVPRAARPRGGPFHLRRAPSQLDLRHRALLLAVDYARRYRHGGHAHDIRAARTREAAGRVLDRRREDRPVRPQVLPEVALERGHAGRAGCATVRGPHARHRRPRQVQRGIRHRAGRCDDPLGGRHARERTRGVLHGRLVRDERAEPFRRRGVRSPACRGHRRRFARPQDALAVGEVLRAAVESLRLEDASVTISVGVASYPESGPTPDTLLSAADEALHAASTSGGNRISLAGSAA